MNDNLQPQQPSPNLPVPLQQTTAVGRPAGGRVPPPANWQTGEPEAIPWGQYLDALRRRWWVVVLVFGIGTYIGKQVSDRVPAEYSSFIKIFVGGLGRDAGGPITAPNVLTVNTLQEIVKTPDVVAPVVRRLGLNVRFTSKDSTLFRGFTYDSVFSAGNYRFTVDSTGSAYTLEHNPQFPSPEAETGVLGDSVGREFGFNWVPPIKKLKPKQVVEFSVSPVIYTAMSLAGKLRPAFDPDGGQVLTLYLESNDKGTIAPTLNEWAKEFIDYTAEKKRASLSERRRIIEQQLGGAKYQLDIAERNLREFRESTLFLPQENPGTTALAGNVAQLDQIKRDRARIQAVLETLEASPPNDPKIEDGRLYASNTLMAANPRLPTALQSLATADAEVRNLRRDFTDSASQVQLALAERNAIARNIIPEILKDIDENFAETEARLSTEVDSKRSEIARIPRTTFEGQRRAREFAAAERLWNDLNESATQVRILGEQTSADLQIMGPAIPPPGPSSSRGPRLFLLSVAASLGLGLAIALLLDRLDRRFRYPQQATHELGLTIAGTIPFFRPNRKGELNLTASAQVVESFRTLRLATQFHFPPGEPVVVCISSPGPAEGKSLVASNLAVAFANAGQKTLLIDGDVRRGVVHTTFETDRRPGLVDYLGGTATASQVVRPTTTDNLFVIPSGSRSRRAPELLVSDRMQALIAEMRLEYEVIIVDSAPFVAGMDAFALGAAAGTMLVVLRPGATDRKLAENKLEILDRLPVTIIGAVLNAISGGRAYRYYSDYATYDGPEDNLDEADFDQAAPPTSPTRLIGRR